MKISFTLFPHTLNKRQLFYKSPQITFGSRFESREMRDGVFCLDENNEVNKAPFVIDVKAFCFPMCVEKVLRPHFHFCCTVG